MASSVINFREVTHDDLLMLRGWMETPHMREWWGDPEKELSYIVDMIEGRDTTRPFIIVIDGQDIGYIQYWFIGHHQNEKWIDENPWLMALPSDALGLDISIGEASRLSSGIGSAAIRKLAEQLYAEGHTNLIIDPDIENARAIRAYEKAGFSPIPSLIGKTDDILLMQFHPSDTAAK